MIGVVFRIDQFTILKNNILEIFPCLLFKRRIPQEGRWMVHGHDQAVVPGDPGTPQPGDPQIRSDQAFECRRSQEDDDLRIDQVDLL